MRDNYKSIAESGAKKICGIGNCHAAYACGHTNKSGYISELLGTEKECPLAKYNVEFETPTRPWWSTPREEREVNSDEIFALCYNCRHATAEHDCVTRINLHTVCIDCPVKMCEDAIDEANAEAEAMGM